MPRKILKIPLLQAYELLNSSNRGYKTRKQIGLEKLESLSNDDDSVSVGKLRNFLKEILHINSLKRVLWNTMNHRLENEVDLSHRLEEEVDPNHRLEDEGYLYHDPD